MENKTITEQKYDWFIQQINALKQAKVSKAEIARRLNIKPQALNNLIHKQRNITDKFIEKFISTFSLQENQLFENTSAKKTPSKIKEKRDEYTSFMEGWWNCFSSFSEEILSNGITGTSNENNCLNVLTSAGITTIEANTWLKTEEASLRNNAAAIVKKYLDTI